MGQLLFPRNPTSNHGWNTSIFQARSKQFVAGDYHLAVAARRRNYDMSLLKERHPRQKTNASRAVKAVKHACSGFISNQQGFESGAQLWGCSFERRGLCADTTPNTPRQRRMSGSHLLRLEMVMSALRTLHFEANPSPRKFNAAFTPVRG